MDDDQNPAGLPEQVRVRLAKRERLLAEGTEPYPVGFPRTATIAEVRGRHKDLPADTATGGLAPLVLSEISVIDAHEPWLTLIGLRLVFERNIAGR